MSSPNSPQNGDPPPSSRPPWPELKPLDLGKLPSALTTTTGDFLKQANEQMDELGPVNSASPLPTAHSPWVCLNAELNELGVSVVTLLDNDPDPASLQQVLASLLQQLKSKNELIERLRSDVSELHKENLALLQSNNSLETAEEEKQSLNRQLKRRNKEIAGLIDKLETTHPSTSPEERYPSKKQPKDRDLQKFLHTLEARTPKEALALIVKLQQVALTLPKISKFIELLCTEVLGTTSYSPDLLISRVQHLKAECSQLRELKTALCQSFGLASSASNADFLEHSQLILHIKALFQIEETDEIEQIYWFVHETKKFLFNVRKKLATPEAVPFHKLLRHIYKSL